MITTAITTSTTGSRSRISVTGPVTDTDTAQLRTLLVSAIWHQRPEEIIVDLGSGVVLDDLTIGGLSAAATIAADHHLRLGVRCANPLLAGRLAAAGILLLDADH